MDNLPITTNNTDHLDSRSHHFEAKIDGHFEICDVIFYPVTSVKGLIFTVSIYNLFIRIVSLLFLFRLIWCVLWILWCPNDLLLLSVVSLLSLLKWFHHGLTLFLMTKQRSQHWMIAIFLFFSFTIYNYAIRAIFWANLPILTTNTVYVCTLVREVVYVQDGSTK